ncbi:MAG: hypothetical protein H7Y32_07570 [Chloroflexales bacterium]|nr:hypothetical protein [Chloroflexales bacterium]
MTHETRLWLGRIALSLLIAAAAGGLVYVVARAGTSANLFYRQQQLLRDITAALQSGDIQQLATADVRARRQQLRALAEDYNRLSAQAAIIAAGIAAVAGYIVLERRAADATRRTGFA